MSYNKDTDYTKLINEAVKNGDYASASQYEKERNEKIEKEGLSYEKTNNYTMPAGVGGETWNKANSSYTPSGKQNALDSTVQGDLSNFRDVASNTNIISQNTKDALNQKFIVPSAVTEADAYLSDQLKKIQSGKTSFSGQIMDMMSQIQNREKFTYDVDSDPLFQQALASAMNSGKTAMQDTIGQASALTGGYGSTYATSAGNQAYNAFIEDAYNNLPQYYQMALEAYQMEGDEMYRQLGMLNEADDKEYSRNVTAYDATYAHRNQMYNEAYTQYRDDKSDAFAMANLELNENSQLVNNAFTLYQASADYADSQYEREYNSWLDSVNQAFKNMEILNSDYWNQSNQDFTASENQKDRDHQSSENQKDRDLTVSENQKDRDHQSSENQKNRDHQSSENQKNRDHQSAENQKNRALKTSDSGNLKSPTQAQMNAALDAYNAGGTAGLSKYLGSLPADIDETLLMDYATNYGNSWAEDYAKVSGWYLSEDNGGWFKDDYADDVFTSPLGGTMSFADLKKEINKLNIPQAKKDELIDNYKKQSKK